MPSNLQLPEPEAPEDTVTSRRKRLQERINEITAQGDRELSAVMEVIERAKATFNFKNKFKK